MARMVIAGSIGFAITNLLLAENTHPVMPQEPRFLLSGVVALVLATIAERHT
jgi:hypothetical protein